MKRLWAWLCGYTVEEWVSDLYRADLALYLGDLASERIEIHAAFPHNPRWHHLVMTCVRGKRRFYFDGRPWPGKLL